MNTSFKRLRVAYLFALSLVAACGTSDTIEAPEVLDRDDLSALSPEARIDYKEALALASQQTPGPGQTQDHDVVAALVPVDQAGEFRASGVDVEAAQGTIAGYVAGSLIPGEPALLDHIGENDNTSILAPGTPTNAVANLFESGEFGYNGGTWGKSYDVVVSQMCNGRTRTGSQAYAYNNNGGYCSVVGWYTQDTSDCRFIVHVGASSFKKGTCAWSVYADELGYFSYNASNTNSAQQNTVNAFIWLDAGQTVTAGTCGLSGASASGDTYLRLFNGGTQVATNDDACGGFSSQIVYTAPVSTKYELRAGCFGSGNCGGTVAYTKK